MITTLPTDITTIEQAQAFIKDLQHNGEDFHYEDSASSLRDVLELSPIDITHLDKLRYRLMVVPNFDPFRYSMAIAAGHTDDNWRDYKSPSELDGD